MHAALGFGLGHALHAVHAALILERAVNLLAADLADDLLVAAGCTLALAVDLHLPAFALEILGVHAEEVAGKDGRLVAAGAAADLEDRVLAVLRVGRNQQQADLLLEGRKLLFQFGSLFLGHFAQILVLLVQENILGPGQVAEQLFVAGACLDDGLQLLVVLVELDVALHVGDHFRIGDLLRNGFVFLTQAFQLVEQGILCHRYLLR